VIERLNPKIILFSGILPRERNLFENGFNPYSLKKLNRKLARINTNLFEAFKGREAFSFCRSGEYYWSTCLSRDGLHLNRKGNAQLGRIFVKDIKSVLNVKSLPKVSATSFSSVSASIEFPALSTVSGKHPSVPITILDNYPRASVISDTSSTHSKPLYSSVLKRVSSVCSTLDSHPDTLGLSDSSVSVLCVPSKPLYSSVLKRVSHVCTTLDSRPNALALPGVLTDLDNHPSISVLLDSPDVLSKPLYSDVLKYGSTNTSLDNHPSGFLLLDFPVLEPIANIVLSILDITAPVSPDSSTPSVHLSVSVSQLSGSLYPVTVASELAINSNFICFSDCFIRFFHFLKVLLTLVQMLMPLHLFPNFLLLLCSILNLLVI
ncbi:uncharacterized protein LOC118185258, partial [Stegodyphus dumicola]|uniref:uncharacterized protein LOC118185258 n=1 Tax=Stegodyphus dumicola TaxID=202533 RepID=UPI0015B2DAC1